LGGLRGHMRVTFLTFAIGMMALAGVPFVFSGFWSKEAILHAAHGWTVSHLPFYVALIAVVLTAFYMTRLVAETFLGKARSDSASHARENSAAMTVPLVVLAICAVGLGFLGTPYWPWLQRTLDPTYQPEAGGAGLMVTSIVLVAVGIGAGLALYARRTRTSVTARDPLAAAAPKIWTALGARLGFDQLYAATIGRLTNGVAAFAAALDHYVVDGTVRFVSRLSVFAGLVHREADEELINGGFDAGSESLRRTANRYSRAQTGDAHGYLRLVAIGFVMLVLIVLLGSVR